MAIPAEGDSVRTRPLREWSLARPRCVLCWKHFRQVPLMVTRERTPTGSGCNGGGGHPLPVRDRLHARLVSTQTPFAAPQLTPILMPSVAVADDPIIEGLGRPGGSVQCTTNGDGYTAILRAWTSQVPPPGDGQRVSSARDARTHLTRHASLSERSNHRQLAPAARGDGDRNCLRQSTTLVHTPANGSEGVHPRLARRWPGRAPSATSSSDLSVFPRLFCSPPASHGSPARKGHPRSAPDRRVHRQPTAPDLSFESFSHAELPPRRAVVDPRPPRHSPPFCRVSPSRPPPRPAPLSPSKLPPFRPASLPHPSQADPQL